MMDELKAIHHSAFVVIMAWLGFCSTKKPNEQFGKGTGNGKKT
jgi:hypothetical protein